MPHSTPHTVMVVTGSETVSDLFGVILHQAGYRSVRVATAIEALHTMTAGKPNLIFLDTNLPGMDGLDFCRLLKDNVYCRDIPVVMLSRTGEFFDDIFGCLVGAEACIAKPFAPESILCCVQTYCRTTSRLPWAAPAGTAQEAFPLSSGSPTSL
jgi:DNA-binding response OmpR family regulator